MTDTPTTCGLCGASGVGLMISEDFLLGEKLAECIDGAACGARRAMKAVTPGAAGGGRLTEMRELLPRYCAEIDCCELATVQCVPHCLGNYCQAHGNEHIAAVGELLTSSEVPF